MKLFKVINTDTGKEFNLDKKEMLVMDDEGTIFIVGNFMDCDAYVDKLSDVCPVFDVIWKGED